MGTTKTCLVCQRDVSTQKRVKDAEGRYYCHPCWNARRSASVAQPSAYVSDDPFLSQLAELEEKAPSEQTQPPQATCAMCRTRIPFDQVHNHKGKPVCFDCLCTLPIEVAPSTPAHRVSRPAPSADSASSSSKSSRERAAATSGPDKALLKKLIIGGVAVVVLVVGIMVVALQGGSGHSGNAEGLPGNEDADEMAARHVREEREQFERGQRETQLAIEAERKAADTAQQQRRQEESAAYAEKLRTDRITLERQMAADRAGAAGGGAGTHGTARRW